jgi:hypothetical protein
MCRMRVYQGELIIDAKEKNERRRKKEEET